MDSSVNLKLSRSHDLFAEAQQLLPGGVNSPVRAFRGVGVSLFLSTVRAVPTCTTWMAIVT